MSPLIKNVLWTSALHNQLQKGWILRPEFALTYMLFCLVLNGLGGLLRFLASVSPHAVVDLTCGLFCPVSIASCAGLYVVLHCRIPDKAEDPVFRYMVLLGSASWGVILFE